MTQNLHFYRHNCCLRLPEVEVLPALGSTPMPCYCQEEADGVGRIFWNELFNKSELLLMIGRDVTVFVFHIYSQHLFHLLAPHEIIVKDKKSVHKRNNGEKRAVKNFSLKCPSLMSCPQLGRHSLTPDLSRFFWYSCIYLSCFTSQKETRFWESSCNNNSYRWIIPDMVLSAFTHIITKVIPILKKRKWRFGEVEQIGTSHGAGKWQKGFKPGSPTWVPNLHNSVWLPTSSFWPSPSPP